MEKGNPQVEEGYTRIANELLEAFLKCRLTEYERIVWLAIVRLTYGWNKKEAKISLRQISSLTGISKKHVSHTLHMLQAKKMVYVKKLKSSQIIGIVKHYKTWKIKGSPHQGTPHQGIPSSGDSKVPSSGDCWSPHQGTLRGRKKRSFNRSPRPKDNIKDIYKNTHNRVGVCEFTNSEFYAFLEEYINPELVDWLRSLKPSRKMLQNICEKAEESPGVVEEALEAAQQYIAGRNGEVRSKVAVIRRAIAEEWIPEELPKRDPVCPICGRRQSEVRGWVNNMCIDCYLKKLGET